MHLAYNFKIDYIGLSHRLEMMLIVGLSIGNISTWSNREVNLTTNQSGLIVNFSRLPTLTKSY